MSMRVPVERVTGVSSVYLYLRAEGGRGRKEARQGARPIISCVFHAPLPRLARHPTCRRHRTSGVSFPVAGAAVLGNDGWKADWTGRPVLRDRFVPSLGGAPAVNRSGGRGQDLEDRPVASSDG